MTNFEGLGDRVLPLLNSFDGTKSKKYALGSDNLDAMKSRGLTVIVLRPHTSNVR
ncbi:MAG: hypothetical protein LBU65_02700 [Planctomycetaceae bacterium]|nr:hypothetical protein [Planctomycetaceae bacterium]